MSVNIGSRIALKMPDMKSFARDELKKFSGDPVGKAKGLMKGLLGRKK